MTISHKPCFGGGIAIGGGILAHVDHTLDKLHIPHPVVDHIVHHGGKSLGMSDMVKLDFTNIPLTPMAHAASLAPAGITVSLVALAGISAVALVLISMMVRTVLVACSR